MRILVSGASGLIGTAVSESLRRAGHAVGKFVRPPGPAASGDVAWDPGSGGIDARSIEGAGAVIHLAGENIASGRWTPAQKARIRESRIQGTALLSRSLAGLAAKPSVFVTASAVGIYGDRGDEVLDETSPPGNGFLPDVCRAWEEAAAPARDAGIRTVHSRFGVVLAGVGGALKKMLLPFKLGVGGRIGGGRQWMSWVALDDAVAALMHVLLTPSLSGAVNVVSPEPVTNAEFTRTLGRALHRPAIFPLPAIAARLALGEMADALLLASARVLPRRLQASGFVFRRPSIAAALDAALKPAPRTSTSAGRGP